MGEINQPIPETILDVQHLKVSFKTNKGLLTAVEDVSFQLERGDILGVVGESGCGKSVTASSLLGLLDTKKAVVDGQILCQGINLATLKEKEFLKIRGSIISMVHQNPMTALDPLYSIGAQLVETIRLHKKISKQNAKQKAIELLQKVGIPSAPVKFHAYPHQLSGGMKQRVMIAIALACEPDILIADEPTTALDVTIQAQILTLLQDLQKEFNMSIVFITHDLGVVAKFCKKVMVMYLGQVVEYTDVKSLFTNPKHPYTKGLLKAAPRIDGNRKERLYNIEGSVPPLSAIPTGCRFANRCPFVEEKCSQVKPGLEDCGTNHTVRCWKHDAIESMEVKIW